MCLVTWPIARNLIGWKKSVPKRSATVQKNVGLNSTFFLNRFDQFCSAHVNKWTVHVSKIFLENNRNRSEPYRTVKRKTGADIRLYGESAVWFVFKKIHKENYVKTCFVGIYLLSWFMFFYKMFLQCFQKNQSIKYWYSYNYHKHRTMVNYFSWLNYIW